MSSQTMNELKSALARHPRLTLAAFAILALSILNFQGALDDFAREEVTDTTVETVGIYGISKLVNRTVSWLKEAPPLGIGQFLDPLDDGIERLSGMAVMAIGSLFLQRIVLDFTASPIFKWIFFGAGLVTLMALALTAFPAFRERVRTVSGLSSPMLDKLAQEAVRVFMIAAMIRFVVPVFIGGSFLFSQMLLQPEMDRSVDELNVLSSTISSQSDTALSDHSDPALPDRSDLLAQREQKTGELATLQETESDHRNDLERVDAEIDGLREQAGIGSTLESLVPERLGGKASDPRMDALKAEREEIENRIEAAEDRIEAVRDDLECIEQQLEGESCDSLMGRTLAGVKGIGGAALTGIKEIAESANESLITIAKLLVILLVKNIVVPLLFLYLAMKHAIRPMLRMASDMKGKLEEETRNTGEEFRKLADRDS
ncbi:MAG: hypothetical protein OXS40_12495 [Gammaproteobacteria bacterium]|nr:hypothetical protein [Gammaproteobacteria bacterium]